MRPTKLTEKVIEALKTVVNEYYNALVCTDEELVFLTNERLEPHERISYRTFQRYKQLAKSHIEDQLYDQYLEPEDATAEKQSLYRALGEQLIRTNIKVKNMCMDEIMQARKGWERYRWLLMLRLKHWNGLGETPMSQKMRRLTAIVPKIKFTCAGEPEEGAQPAV